MASSSAPASARFDKASSSLGDYHRPRRPNADTIRYLRSLPLDAMDSLAQIRAFVQARRQHEDNLASLEYPSALAAALSALDEVGQEVASLAGDEHASEAVELLVRLTAPFSVCAARKLLAACSGYAVFLATHRYGSHVFQSILELAVTAEASEDVAEHEDSPGLGGMDELPSLTQSLLALHAEILPHIPALAVHICGSHIVRTLSLVLGGLQQQPQVHHPSSFSFGRRGGKSKAKHKNKHKGKSDQALALSVSPTADLSLQAIPQCRIQTTEPAMAHALDQLVTAISGARVQPPGRLQELACHTSAGPLLMVLLRVLTYREVLLLAKDDEEPPGLDSTFPTANTSELVVAHAFSPTTTTTPHHHLARLPTEPHFGERSPAQALAHRLLCWQISDDDSQTEAAAQTHAGNVLYGLAGEPRGSHVLDTLLRLAPDTFYQSILAAGDFLSSQSLQEYVEHDVSNFVIQTILATTRTGSQAMAISDALQPHAWLILDASKRRRGILWRWAEMAVRFPECQDKVIQALSSALAVWQSNGTVSHHCAATLLGMKDSPDGDRLILNVEGTRALHHLLRFQNRAARGVWESVLALSAGDLERLARDGLGSRCVWDAILISSVHHKAVPNKLWQRLQGRWVSLAMDRVGHHVVRKLFFGLPHMVAREGLVQELAEGSVRLEGNAMGRKIAALCKVREYTSGGKAEWERVVQKSLREKEWLDEMLAPESRQALPAQAPSTATKGGEENHRKRSSGQSVDSDDPNAQENSKRIKEMSMDDIVQAISIPS